MVRKMWAVLVSQRLPEFMDEVVKHHFPFRTRDEARAVAGKIRRHGLHCMDAGMRTVVRRADVVRVKIVRMTVTITRRGKVFKCVEPSRHTAARRT